MQVKLDENLSNTHAEFLQQAGYDCDRVTDEGLSGATDEVVWQEVCREGRFFITLDLDFADIRKFPPGSHPGILLLRPSNSGLQTVLALLIRVLNEYSLEDLRGCFVVVDERQTRIRRPNR
jgi:predicted nuclease of predicted toxin-antitoxin system